MRILLAAEFLLIGTSAWAADATPKNAKNPQQILLVRHAEKSAAADSAHLAPQGLERAGQLYKLFDASPERKNPFPTPDFIFAAKNSTNSHRPLETVTPLAKKMKLTINDQFDSKLPVGGIDKSDHGMAALGTHLFTDKKYFGKTILIAWRHGSIPELAKVLKVDKVPEKWDDSVFDRVWHIGYDDKGVATLVDRPQQLMPGDASK